MWKPMRLQTLCNSQLLACILHKHTAKYLRAYNCDNRFDINPSQVAKPFRQRRRIVQEQNDAIPEDMQKPKVCFRRNSGKPFEAIRHDAMYLKEMQPLDPSSRNYTQTWNEFNVSDTEKAAKKMRHIYRVPKLED